LVEGFKDEDFKYYLFFHYNLYNAQNHEISIDDWNQGYIYAIKEFLITRVSFYEVAGIQARYAFSERILKNSFRMLDILIDK